MPEFERNLTPTEVEWGLIYVGVEKGKYLPVPNEKIIVYDDEGREYIAKMHSYLPRIDRLTEWYNNHPTTKIGDTVVITINPDKSIKFR